MEASITRRKCILVFSLSLNLFSMAQAENAKINQALFKLNQKMNGLQAQVSSLNQQISFLKEEINSAQQHHSQARKFINKRATTPLFSEQIPTQHVNVLHHMFRLNTPIFASPYIGINSSYDGSNLISNEAGINLDYRLLKQVELFQNAVFAQGMMVPDHPIIEISGKLKALAFYNDEPPGKHFNLDLNTAALDVFIKMNRYVQSFLDFEYQNSSQPDSGGDRLNNSRIYLRQGFVTLGELSKFAGYATLGQLYVPFGQYSSRFITNPETQILGRTRERALVLGYRPDDGFYGSAYIFKGNTDVNHAAEGGVNLGYYHRFKNLITHFSAGLISNLAESENLQKPSGLNKIPFSGFSIGSNAEHLKYAVPGLSGYASLGYQQYSFEVQYIKALRHFDPSDLSFNEHGADPQAFHSEVAYHFNIQEKPMAFMLGYDFSQNALALLLPRDRFSAAISMAFWRNTLTTLEYRHDIEYDANNQASGAGSALFKAPSATDDALTLELSVYF